MEILSQDEINQLLTAINAGEGKPRTAGKTLENRKIRIYDFERPKKFFDEHITTITNIFKTFCRLTTVSLSTQIRLMSSFRVASVDQLTYEEFTKCVPSPTAFATINMAPLKGNAILEIDPGITSSIIDRICGGSGKAEVSFHELNNIERPIIEKIIVSMLDNVRETWATVLDLRPQLGAIDTNPQFVQIVPPAEPVILISIEAKIGDTEGMINFCIPYLTIEPVMEKLSARYWYGNYQKNKPLCISNLRSREEIPVRMSAEILCRDYPVKEVLNWNTGTLILPLCRLSRDNCYLRLGDRRLWQCQILPDYKGLIKRINIINYAEKPFGTEGNDMKIEEGNSLTEEALSNAKIRISVELGSTLKTVKEVFTIGEGTILELDKLAGEPVDVKANGVLFAHGEVVVIDENFGVRIIEVAENPDACGKKESA